MLERDALPRFLRPIPQPSFFAGSSIGDAIGVKSSRLVGLEMRTRGEVCAHPSAVAQCVVQHIEARGDRNDGIASIATCRRDEELPSDPVPQRPHDVRALLAKSGHLRGVLSSRRSPSFAEIRDEIEAGRPIPCRIRWNGGGSHYILISGWTIDADGNEFVHIMDPAAGESGPVIADRIIPYRSFAGGYRLSGCGGRVNISYRVQ